MIAPARCSSSLAVWAAAISVSLLTALASGQVRGSATGLRSGMPDKQVMAYVTSCMGAAPPRPIELYARGGWYMTDDLREQMREHGGSLEGIALVWKERNHPRAVYQWNHDDEFNRDVVACIDPQGRVLRSQSHYTPGDSEPKQRWVYIHTLTLSPHQKALQGSGRFTDAQGRPMGRPHLSTEDQDFIAGERVFHHWKDFDFSRLVDAQP